MSSPDLERGEPASTERIRRDVARDLAERTAPQPPAPARDIFRTLAAIHALTIGAPPPRPRPLRLAALNGVRVDG